MGTGFSFDRLSEKGAFLTTSQGEASGPVSFMQVFNKASQTVEQGGKRRAANMGILSCDHPDIIEFIEVKNKKECSICGEVVDRNVFKCPKCGNKLPEDNTLNYFNLSVGVNSKFVKCAIDLVENEIDNDWELYSRRNEGEVVKVIKFSELWDKIIYYAWYSGDPGLVNLYEINKNNPMRNYKLIESTNPCVVGDTLILTKQGYKPIKDLVNKEVEIWNGYNWSKVTPEITGRDQEIIDIEFSNGSKLSCTPYHKFVLKDGNRIEAQDLKEGDKLSKWKYPLVEGSLEFENEKQAYTQGFFSGDGSIETTRDRNSIGLYGEKIELLDYFDYINKWDCKEKTVITLDTRRYRDKTFVPFNYTIKDRLDWLSGLIDSDGTLNDKTGSISITSVDRDFLVNVQLLLNTLGCHSSLSINKEGGANLLPDGNGGLKEYNTQTCYRIAISAYNVKKLMELGLDTKRVPLIANPNRDASRFITVTSINKRDKKEKLVYCFNEPKNHTGIFNGIMTAQCGEQPLLPYDSCNLGSINLDVLTSDDGELDYKELDRVTRLAVDFLDNVIDVNNYPLPEINKATKDTRNIGLGVMGVARMLQKMEIPYDSKRGRAKVYEIIEVIQKVANNQSVRRAEKYGTFPLWEKSIYCQDRIKYRNATRTTIAPTGSISTLADTSGGIEPDFSHRFTRIVNIGDKEKEFRIIVENPVLVDKLKKYGLYSNELMQEIEDNGGRLPDVYNSSILRGLSKNTLDKYQELREIFKTAGEISIKGHIDMLIETQRVIDNAISKTINMPNEATIEDVENAFLRMLKGGAKGVTVYRDGSRMFQPLQLNIKNTEVEEKEDKKARGYVEPPQDELPSIKKRLYTGCGKLYVHADYDSKTGDIKEIFIDKGSTGGCLVFTKATSRLLSVGIRGGIPLEVLVDQLNSAGSCPSWQLAKGKGNELSVGMSCPSAIGREIMRIQEKLYKDLDKNNITKSYKKVEVPKEVEKEEKPKCPECGEELSSESGCIVCRHCGYSKC